MSEWIYVVDTHAFVRFAKAFPTLGARALSVMRDPRSKLVLPLHCFEELRQKFIDGRDPMWIPPTASLRLVLSSSNVKVFPRGPAVITEEFRLSRAFRNQKTQVPKQDIPICATLLAIRRHHGDRVGMISVDPKIKLWCQANQITVVW